MQKDIIAYLAAPFFSEEQLEVVEAIENLLNNSYIQHYSPRSEGVLVDMTKEQRKERMSYLFSQNVLNLNLCTHVIAVVDDYDTGTVWEMGYAFATNKKIVTYTNNYYGINVMLNESIQFHCKKLDEIIPSLLNKFSGEKTNEVI